MYIFAQIISAMKISDNVQNSIDRLPLGFVFTYADISIEVKNREAIIKSLNRMVASGKLQKIAKGKYYKPESSTFGSLPPIQYQVVKDLLIKNGKQIGYITGIGAFNELGLTTQISNTIQIGKNEIRSSIQRGLYKITFVKQKNIITKENVQLLKLLDAIRLIRTIPDASLQSSTQRISMILSKFSETEIDSMIKLAMSYPPSTRALLGALLEQTSTSKNIETLRKSVNPITSYKIGIQESFLPNAKRWNLL